MPKWPIGSALTDSAALVFALGTYILSIGLICLELTAVGENSLLKSPFLPRVKIFVRLENIFHFDKPEASFLTVQFPVLKSALVFEPELIHDLSVLWVLYLEITFEGPIKL
jgi:hypothetical protein